MYDYTLEESKEIKLLGMMQWMCLGEEASSNQKQVTDGVCRMSEKCYSCEKIPELLCLSQGNG